MTHPSPPAIPRPSPCCYQSLPPPPEESPRPPVPAPANCTVLGTAVKYDESEPLSLNDRGPGVDVPSPSHTSPRPRGAPPLPPPAHLPPHAAGSHAGSLLGFHAAGSCRVLLPSRFSHASSDNSDDSDHGRSALDFPPTEGQIELFARADAAAAVMEKRFKIRYIATSAVRKQSSDQVKECVQNTSASSGRTFVFVCACNLTRSRSGWDSSLKKTTWRRVACGHCPSQRPQPG